MRCARKAQSWAPGKGRKKGANCWWEGAKRHGLQTCFYFVCVFVPWHKLAPNCPSPLLVHRHTLPFRPVFSSVLGTEELCSYFVLSVDLQPSTDGIFACLLLLMLIVVVVPRHQLRTHSFFYWKFNWSTFLLQYCNLGDAKCWMCDCVIAWFLLISSRFVQFELISSSLQCSALFCYSLFHRLCCGTLFPFPYLSFCNQRLWWARERVGRNSNCLVFFLNCLSTLIDCQSELPLSSFPLYLSQLISN